MATAIEDPAQQDTGSSHKIIVALATAAHDRKAAIADAAAIKRAAAEAQAAERKRARAIHRDANRALLAAIDYARSTGMQLVEVAEHIGLSVQTISQMRRTIASWDRDGQDEEE